MTHLLLGYLAIAGASVVLALPLIAVLDMYVGRAVTRHVDTALSDPLTAFRNYDEFDVWVDEALDLTREDPRDLPSPRRRGADLWR